MKKFLSVFLIAYIILGSINFSFGQVDFQTQAEQQQKASQASAAATPTSTLPPPVVSDALPQAPTNNGMDTSTPGGTTQVTNLQQNNNTLQNTLNEFPSTTSTSTSSECKPFYGITMCPDCLLNGQCKFNIYDALGIRQNVRNPEDATSVGIFVQDIVLSATMFIGTIITVAIVVSGFMRILAGASGKDPTKAKTGLINSLIGLLLVISSYMIIRIVQYIAKGF